MASRKRHSPLNGKATFGSNLDTSSESDQGPVSSDDSDSDSTTGMAQKQKSVHKSPDSGATENNRLFSLTCLHTWDKSRMASSFTKYHSEKIDHHFKPKIGSKKQSLSTDEGKADHTSLSAWWDNFATTTGPKKSSHDNKRHNKDSDAVVDWFSKTQMAESRSSTWLAGPGPSSGTQQTKIEDIDVPSIYNTKPNTKGRRALKKQRKAEREKTSGKKWFDMKAPDVDDKLKNDMELIRMRGVLDPKRFYKNNDRKALPKYFQMGTVVDEGSDFYSSRLSKKQRKQTLVEQLMADADVRQYNKKKYSQLQQKVRSKKWFRGKKTSTKKNSQEK